MIIVVLSQAAQIDKMSTPFKGKVDPASFYGLSSVFFEGTFIDLDSSHYSATIGTQTCEILSLSQTELECLIPPWDSSDGTSAELRVEHNGSEVYSKNLDHGNAYPIINLNRNEASAGDDFHIFQLWGNSDWVSSGSLENESLTTKSGWGGPYFKGGKAELGSNVHGDSKIKLEVNGNQEPDMMWTAASYTLQGEEYFFRTIASVDSISHSEGSGLGGLEITINGKSFPSEAGRIRVEIDGTNCEVTSASFNSITCKTGAYYKITQESHYEGSAGLFRERYDYNGVNYEYNPEDLESEEYIPNSNLHYSLVKGFRIYGYFKAPRTGEYTFYGSVNKDAKVYLSTDADPSNKIRIMYLRPWSIPSSYFYGQYKSNKITLSKDQLYYLEIEHINCCDIGFFSLGVEIPGDGNFYRNRMPLVKKIKFTDSHPSTPIEYKGQRKDIGNLDCNGNNYYQKQVSSQYFNLYIYCVKGNLYVVVPGYMNPQPDDLKFVTNTNSILDGSTLHKPSDSQFWFVIPSDFLRTYQTKPQLRVWIDGRVAMSKGDSSFQYRVPLIRSFSESSSIVTINGENFLTDTSELEIKIGPAECTVKSISDSLIECELYSYTQGNYRPQMTYSSYYAVPLDPSINYYISLTCTSCLRCYSPSIFECLECEEGQYLVNGICGAVCPTGYTCSKTGSIGPEFAFDLKLNTLQNVVYDSENSIPVLTGINNQFHPFFHETDPYPTKDRGFYFRGSSVMQLPPYRDVLDPLLVLAPQFTVSMWSRPLSSSGTLLSKQHSNHINILEVGLSDYSLYAALDETFQSPDKLNNYWNLVSVRTSVDQDQFNLEAYYNSTKVLSKSLGEDWFKDSDSNFHFTIGAKHSPSNFREFFTGFIWQVRIYNSAIQINSLLQNSNKYLPLCTIHQFWNGNQCNDCSHYCKFGCVNNSTCTLCGNNLCLDCDFEECNSCVDNAFINTSKTCECNQGYIEDHGFCNRGRFYANLTSKSKELSLEFSEDLMTQLSKEDFEISLRNTTIKFSYEMKLASERKYKITMSFDTYVPDKQPVLLEFKTEVTSESNYLLANKTLEAELHQYDPSLSVIQESRNRTQVVTGITILAVIILVLFNSKASDLWRFMNMLEILSYIPSTNNKLTPTLIGFFEGLSVLNFIPVAIDYCIRIVTGEESDYFTKYLLRESELFLLNAGVSILIMIVLLGLWPVVWVLSKIPCCKKPFGKLLAEYKFNTFTRYWIQCYLDLSIAGFIQLVSVPNVEVVWVFNYTSACLVVGLLAPTSSALFVLIRRNTEKITSEEERFLQRWGTLLYEFECTENLEAPFFYCAFTLNRLIFAASVAILGTYPYVQAIVDLICMLGLLVFMVAVKPYLTKAALRISILTEIVVSLVFLLVIYFLQSDWKTLDTLVEKTIIFSVVGVSAIHSLVPLFRLFARCCSKKTGSVARVVVLDGNTPGEVNQTEGNVNITTFSPENQANEGPFSIQEGISRKE